MKASRTVGIIMIGFMGVVAAAILRSHSNRRPTASPPEGSFQQPTATDRARPASQQPSGSSDDDDEAAYLEAVARRSLQENCSTCHDDSMITQQRLTPAQWKAEIEKMVSWGAALPVEAQRPLFAYLARHFSDQDPLPPPGRSTLRAIKSLERSDPGVPRTIPSGDSRRGERLYAANCANCHGAKAMGGDPGPSLVNKAILAHPDAYHNQVSKGLRRMPGFQNVLTAAQQVDLLTWLREQRYPEIVSSQK